MLKKAILYEEEVKTKYMEAMTQDRFKYYAGGSYLYFDLEIKKNDWNEIQRVSVDKDNKVIGFLSAEINRVTKNMKFFGIMHFDETPDIVFSRDVISFLRELRDNYLANKFNFLAYKGSPAQKLYDKFILKHGGRVVGIQLQDQILSDGKLYDSKLYEILREEMKF